MFWENVMKIVKSAFANVGKKLMWVAVISAIVEFVAAFFVGFCMLFIDDMAGFGFLLMVFSPVVFFIAAAMAWPLYAFGQITDDISAMRNNAGETKNDELPEL